MPLGINIQKPKVYNSHTLSKPLKFLKYNQGGDFIVTSLGLRLDFFGVR